MEQQGKATDKTARARGYIVSLWPALPFMGFGFCAAWNALAQGTAWLSPIETNGTAITNLTMVINIATGVCLLVAGILGGRMTQILTDRRFTSAAGIVAALASQAGCALSVLRASLEHLCLPCRAGFSHVGAAP